jgi:hypothetical protein
MRGTMPGLFNFRPLLNAAPALFQPPAYRLTMAFRVCLFSAFCLSLLLGSVIAAALQEGEDAGKLLEMASQSEPKEATKHLMKVIKVLENEKTLARGERADLMRRLARVMQEKLRLPHDVETVLGPQATRQVARQVYYRRYLEHWIFEAPVSLWVTLDCSKGSDPVIRGIQPWSTDGPRPLRRKRKRRFSRRFLFARCDL